MTASQPCASELFVPRYWAAANSIHAMVGDAACSSYFECRLGDGAGQTDLLVAVPGPSSLDLAERIAQVPGHDHVLRFCRAWNDPDNPLYRECSSIWLEYDDLGRRGEIPSPSISACLVRRYLNFLDPAAPGSEAENMQLLEAALEALPAACARASGRLATMLRTLPPGARLIHLSVMHGRTEPALKVYAVIPRSGLGAYLARNDWRGPLGTIEGLCDDFCPPTRVGGELYVDFTITNFEADGGSRLGLVFSPQHLARSSEPDPGRGPTLEAFRSHGLCTAAEVSELRGWPGRDKEGATITERWLDLKLVWQAGAPLAAKAYLGWSRRPARLFD